MEQTLAERNKQFALKAFETLFNRHDYDAAATMWSEGYIQHSTHIGPGRTGLFERVRSFPATFRYENALAVADGDYLWLDSYQQPVESVTSRRWWGSPSHSSSRHATAGS